MPLVALYLFARLRGLEPAADLPRRDAARALGAALIAQGDKSWDATWKWGRALTIWLGALVSPWAADLLHANRLVSVALGRGDARRHGRDRAAAARARGPRCRRASSTCSARSRSSTTGWRSRRPACPRFTALTLLFGIHVAESGRRLFAVLAGLVAARSPCLVKAIGVLVLPIPLVTVLVLGPLRERLGALALVYAVGPAARDLGPAALRGQRERPAHGRALHGRRRRLRGRGSRRASPREPAGSGPGARRRSGPARARRRGARRRAPRPQGPCCWRCSRPTRSWRSPALLTWREPRYLLPAAVPLLVLAAGTLDGLLTRLLAWRIARPRGRRSAMAHRGGRGRWCSFPRCGSTLRSGPIPSRAAMPERRPLPVRARLALGLRGARHRAAGARGARTPPAAA